MTCRNFIKPDNEAKIVNSILWSNHGKAEIVTNAFTL